LPKRKQARPEHENADDPVGFGITSIPEPLQRWWLIGEGNPYFDEECDVARSELGIPPGGFTSTDDYIDYAIDRGPNHGHDVPEYFKGPKIREFEKAELLTMEEVHAPPACCDSDPLYLAARDLAERFGIKEAEMEPGFADSTQQVANYLVSRYWRKRLSAKGLRVATSVKVRDFTPGNEGKWIKNRDVEKYPGIESRGGEGNRLPLWLDWWKRHRKRDTLGEIVDAVMEDYGDEFEYDERSIRHGIDEVERLMKPP